MDLDMEVVVLVEGELEFMGLREVCIMGLGDLVMVGAWVATVEVMVGALEDLWEEVTEMVGVVMEFMEDASHIKEDFTEALLEALLEVVMAWVAMDMDNAEAKETTFYIIIYNFLLWLFSKTKQQFLSNILMHIKLPKHIFVSSKQFHK